MFDYSRRISRFHEDHVRLTNAQRADMKRRREVNEQRIVDGLAELKKPEVVETIPQGGYAQRTMVQPPEADQESRYDIDLGMVFEEADAAAPRTTRGWVRDAIARKASNLKNEPLINKKCVRVIYADGYQCDFPVFRRRWTDEGWAYELSAGDGWVSSDPAAINKWIDLQVSAKSPEQSGSYQVRRIIRLGKFYSKTHANRLSRKFPSGLVASAIFIETYVSVDGRDGEAFRKTLRAISSRSKCRPVYANGVQVSDEKDIDRIGRLIEQAKESVEELDALGNDATEADARKAWRKVFRHSFFDEPKDEASAFCGSLEEKSALGVGLAAPYLPSAAAAALSDAERVERMKAAVNVRQGSGSKPWSA